MKTTTSRIKCSPVLQVSPIPELNEQSSQRLYPVRSPCVRSGEGFRDGSPTPGVPNLVYMYPWGYICLSDGVHLRLAIEGKNIFTCCLFSNLYTYITYTIFKSHMYIVKYTCEKS